LREFCGCGYAGWRITRLRRSGKLARPYICLLIILLTVPSTLPELYGRVSPFMTASLSFRIPVANERSSGWSSASTAASQASRPVLPVRSAIISANAVIWPASESRCGHWARMPASWACSPGWRWSGLVSSRRVIWRVLGTEGGGSGAASVFRNGAR
jgi:hypothetical protein